jgi:hypothetical protein
MYGSEISLRCSSRTPVVVNRRKTMVHPGDPRKEKDDLLLKLSTSSCDPCLTLARVVMMASRKRLSWRGSGLPKYGILGDLSLGCWE